jgi:MraZ protein
MLWDQMVTSGEIGLMLLTGTYERALDEKLRFALPKKFRELLAGIEPLVLTPGTDGSLAIFPQRAFSAFADRLASRSPTSQDVRAFSRALYAQSQSVDFDSQGRIRLPAELARMADLEEDLVLIGVGDHIELWNKSRWEAYLAHIGPRYDQLAESALSDMPTPTPRTQHVPEKSPTPTQPR